MKDELDLQARIRQAQDKLKPRMRKFAESYFVIDNATQAAKDAGYSEKTAYSQGHRLLNRVDIDTYLKLLQEEFYESKKATKDQVIIELTRIGLFDPRKLFNDDGSPKPINELDDDTAAAIAGLDVMEVYEGYGEERTFVGYSKKYKLGDKKGALDTLAKYHGLLIEKQEITGDKGGPIMVRFVDPRE